MQVFRSETDWHLKDVPLSRVRRGGDPDTLVDFLSLLIALMRNVKLPATPTQLLQAHAAQHGLIWWEKDFQGSVMCKS